MNGVLSGLLQHRCGGRSNNRHRRDRLKNTKAQQEALQEALDFCVIFKLGVSAQRDNLHSDLTVHGASTKDRQCIEDHMGSAPHTQPAVA